jgi:hypothetical protein
MSSKSEGSRCRLLTSSTMRLAIWPVARAAMALRTVAPLKEASGRAPFGVLASGRFAGLATQPTNGVSGQACHAPTRLSPPQRWSACLRRWSASSTTIVRNQVGLRARPSGPRAWGSARDSATNSDSSRFAQSTYAPDGTGPDHQAVEPPDERRHFCASADFGLDGRPLSPHRGTALAFRRTARLASASPESAS